MVEPLSALLMIICSFTFRLCRASLCSLVRLSVFVCVMLGNLFDISFVVSFEKRVGDRVRGCF